jgi:DNA-binding transcriptional MerR regulator
MTIQELSEQSGVPIRTVRYYIGQGLLPSAEGRGRTASYAEDHLLRLRVIRELADRGVPLGEIRGQVAGLSTRELERTLAGEQERGASEEAARSRSPREYVGVLLARARADRAAPARRAADPRPAPQGRHAGHELWQRITLAPGVELHVSSGAGEQGRRIVDAVLGAVAPQARRREK